MLAGTREVPMRLIDSEDSSGPIPDDVRVVFDIMYSQRRPYMDAIEILTERQIRDVMREVIAEAPG